MSAPTVSAMPSSAPSPFDREDADVILRTSDNVEFRVHRITLLMASSVFDTMLNLPQSSDPSDLKAVDVTEDSRTMETLLRVCYPVAEPSIRVVEDARSVLDAALKYDIDQAIASAKKWLFALITNDPLRIYAIACRHGFEDMARTAALKAIKQQAIADVYIPEFEEISAGCYHRLLQYQRGRLPDAAHFLFCHPARTSESYEDSKQGKIEPPSCDVPSTSDNVNADVVNVAILEPTPSVVAPPPFYRTDADVILRSSDRVDFHVHRYTK